MANSIPPLPDFLKKLIASAPLLLAISALVTSFAQYRPASVDTKLVNSFENINSQVHNLSNELLETNKGLANLQIQMNEEDSKKKVIAELEYSSAIIEAREIRLKFGNEVAKKYLENKEKIKNEIVKGIQ